MGLEKDREAIKELQDVVLHLANAVAALGGRLDILEKSTEKLKEDMPGYFYGND